MRRPERYRSNFVCPTEVRNRRNCNVPSLSSLTLADPPRARTDFQAPLLAAEATSCNTSNDCKLPNVAVGRLVLRPPTFTLPRPIGRGGPGPSSSLARASPLPNFMVAKEARGAHSGEGHFGRAAKFAARRARATKANNGALFSRSARPEGGELRQPATPLHRPLRIGLPGSRDRKLKTRQQPYLCTSP